MTKGQRTIVALLAAVAVLLGLNLLSGTPEAKAQVEEVGGACCLGDGTCVQVIESGCNTVGGVFHGGECISVDCTIPRVVSVTVVDQAGDIIRLLRAWSNGDVDMTWVQFGGNCVVFNQCGPLPIIPPPCPADVNDDLSVNVLDLIDLLLVFGSTCPAAG